MGPLGVIEPAFEADPRHRGSAAAGPQPLYPLVAVNVSKRPPPTTTIAGKRQRAKPRQSKL